MGMENAAKGFGETHAHRVRAEPGVRESSVVPTGLGSAFIPPTRHCRAWLSRAVPTGLVLISLSLPRTYVLGYFMPPLRGLDA